MEIVGVSPIWLWQSLRSCVWWTVFSRLDVAAQLIMIGCDQIVLSLNMIVFHVRKVLDVTSQIFLKIFTNLEVYKMSFARNFKHLFMSYSHSFQTQTPY